MSFVKAIIIHVQGFELDTYSMHVVHTETRTPIHRLAHAGICPGPYCTSANITCSRMCIDFFHSVVRHHQMF